MTCISRNEAHLSGRDKSSSQLVTSDLPPLKASRQSWGQPLLPAACLTLAGTSQPVIWTQVRGMGHLGCLRGSPPYIYTVPRCSHSRALEASNCSHFKYSKFNLEWRQVILKRTHDCYIWSSNEWLRKFNSCNYSTCFWYHAFVTNCLVKWELVQDFSSAANKSPIVLCLDVHSLR